MKFSEQWLRSWINPPVNSLALANQLTMAGLEVASVTAVGAKFSNVVVGEVLAVEDHPDAKRLHCCQVKLDDDEIVTIVCGASNVRAGLKVAVAKVGAVLTGNLTITQADLRGVQSYGMICSARELGLSERDEGGIMELPSDSPLGCNIADYMQLQDQVFDIELTANRGDCLSIRGIAREISVYNHLPFIDKNISPVSATITDTVDIHVQAAEFCPRYVGRVIRNINNKASTPIWLSERLRRNGLRSIHPVVDVTNYVMLELGQPMHAFDLSKLQGNIHIRMAKDGETIRLLDGNEQKLDEKTLVIADAASVQAIAGIMGGLNSSVTETTTDIFLESAYFDPTNISLTGRRCTLQTDSSYRFARGVDFNGQLLAIEYATHLLLEIVGGEIAPVSEQLASEFLPRSPRINLRRERVRKLLGVSIDDAKIMRILLALGLDCLPNSAGWEVSVPAHRFDITVEVDLIEEIARIHGYQNIPSQALKAALVMPEYSESQLSPRRISQLLIDKGYHEAISYSFIDLPTQKLLDPTHSAIALANPLSASMAVMRTSLWPGLLQAAQYNINRQIERVRLFEIGMCFFQQQDEQWEQINRIGGVITGQILPQQWSAQKRPVDFYDIKGDVESLLMITGRTQDFVWQGSNHPALHPGQQAALFCHGAVIGYLGAIHPQVQQQLDIHVPIFVFEFDLLPLLTAVTPQFAPISKFPQVQRDIAITVAQDVATSDILQFIKASSGEILTHIAIFDVYQGDKIAKGQKSLAFCLTFQAISRTLTDTEINEIIAIILQQLEKQFSAKLRV